MTGARAAGRGRGVDVGVAGRRRGGGAAGRVDGDRDPAGLGQHDALPDPGPGPAPAAAAAPAERAAAIPVGLGRVPGRGVAGRRAGRPALGAGPRPGGDHHLRRHPGDVAGAGADAARGAALGPATRRRRRVAGTGPAEVAAAEPACRAPDVADRLGVAPGVAERVRASTTRSTSTPWTPRRRPTRTRVAAERADHQDYERLRWPCWPTATRPAPAARRPRDRRHRSEPVQAQLDAEEVRLPPARPRSSDSAERATAPYAQPSSLRSVRPVRSTTPGRARW